MEFLGDEKISFNAMLLRSKVVVLFCCFLLQLSIQGNAKAEGSYTSYLNGSHLIEVFPLTAPRISSKFGPRFHPIKKYSSTHAGVDLAAPSSAHIRTVAPGTVIYAGRYAGYGKLVTVMHKDNYSSLYGHLDDILVNVGDNVKAGQLIGRVGSTGVSTGPHLHFEWRYKGTPLDPMKVLPELSEQPEG